MWVCMKIRISLAVACLFALCSCDDGHINDGHGAIPIAGQSHAFIDGTPAATQPIDVVPLSHPFMAAPGRSAMHSDGASSDTHPFPSPRGHNTQVNSRRGARWAGGMCATVTFDREGNLVALCTSGISLSLTLLAPRTLETLAQFPLPGRPSTFAALVHRDVEKIMSDTSGGAYFFLDYEDRVVLADSRQHVQRIGHRRVVGEGKASEGMAQGDGASSWEFYLDREWDLSAQVPNDCLDWDNWFPTGECDPMTAVMPDYRGLIWWVTRKGRIGTLSAESGIVRVLQLDGEEIQNGFSVADDGVYVVSDHALYGLQAKPDGTPTVLWREIYDRGTSRKIGAINQGSGTTPTLLGENYVSITDNADGRINLLVYRRRASMSGARLVCKTPLFEVGASATDNSTIGFDRTLLVENNAGYQNAIVQRDWSAVAGGIERVDIREDESGCDVVWQSRERSPSTVAKLSLQTGLAYYYTFDRPAVDGDNQWYLTAIDVRSGETRLRVPTGTGRRFDNNWAPISLGPDGTAYIGVINGLVAVWDAEGN